MMAPDYNFYVVAYGGTLSADVFKENVPEAVSFVKYLVGFNAIDSKRKKDAFKRAVCASVDAFAQYGDGGIGTFSIGSFSAGQGAHAGSVNARDVAKQKAMGELLKAGLLWGGVA